jgi:hypothetical protein
MRVGVDAWDEEICQLKNEQFSAKEKRTKLSSTTNPMLRPISARYEIMFNIKFLTFDGKPFWHGPNLQK